MSAKWVRERRSGAKQDDAEMASAPSRLVRPLGQGEAFVRLVRQARQGRLPHGLLVEGARGVGKTTVVQWLTAALLCPSELDTDEPCGVCRTCARVANELHPDVLVLRRPRDENEHVPKHTSWYVVTIKQVREAQERLLHHAVEGGARVAAIVEADRLDEEGQNALLKTLEEPGERTFLLLEASRPEQMLPTVRSRVQRLRVLPLHDDVLRSELARRIPEAAARLDDLVGLAHGSLGLGLTAATERAVQLHDLVRRWLGEAHSLRPVATSQQALAGAPERRLELEQARLFLWLLRSELRRQRDALASAGGDSYPAASLEPWTSWLERTLEAERDLDLMIPPEQVLTACLVQLMA